MKQLDQKLEGYKPKIKKTDMITQLMRNGGDVEEAYRCLTRQ